MNSHREVYEDLLKLAAEPEAPEEEIPAGFEESEIENLGEGITEPELSEAEAKKTRRGLFGGKYRPNTNPHGILQMINDLGEVRTGVLHRFFPLDGVSTLTFMRRDKLIRKEGGPTSPWKLTPLGEILLKTQGAYSLDQAWESWAHSCQRGEGCYHRSLPYSKNLYLSFPRSSPEAEITYPWKTKNIEKIKYMLRQQKESY
jgi:hypothetical protein